MRMLRRIPPLIGLAFLALSARADGPGSSTDEFFERAVRPILVERCAECHGDRPTPKGGLRLTSRAGLLRGGDSGPAAVPGKPEESLLVEAIRYVDEPRMPPRKKLTDREIEALTRWVALGLPWPEPKVETSAATPAAWRITDDQRQFWSFQPVRDVPPPDVRDSDLAPIDHRSLSPRRGSRREGSSPRRKPSSGR